MSSTDASQTPATADQKKTRVQMIDVLDIFVPPPRVRNYFTKKLSEVEKHFELKQLKKKDDSTQTAQTASSSTAPSTTEEAASTEVTQEIRLSPEANAALAVVSSTLLVDIIKHAMNNALAANMKRVTTAHFLSQKLNTLDSQSLVEHLSSVKSKLAALATAQPATRADKAAQQPGGKQKKTKIKKTKKSKSADDAQPEATLQQAEEGTQQALAQVEAAEPTTEGDDASKKEPEFVTYVARAFADVKSKDARYAELMLANDFKVFLSAVLIEFVQSVATLSMVFIEAMDLKTIKHRVVMKVIKSMLVLHGRFDVFALYKTEVDEKLKLYESYEHKDAAEQSTTSDQSTTSA